MDKIVDPDTQVEHLVDSSGKKTICGKDIEDWEKSDLESVEKCKVCEKIAENEGYLGKT